MRRLRIAMVAACPFPWPRGTPIRILRIAEALGRRGHDVHVVTYHFGDATPISGITIHRIAGPASYARAAPGPTAVKLALLDPRLARRLHALLASQPFDLIHAHHYEGLICALLARRRHGPPLIYDAHALLEGELPSYATVARGPYRWVGRVLDRRLPPRADHVITVSEELRQALAAGRRVRASRLSIVGNGVEAEHFRRDPVGFPHPLVAFAGNLAPYQRIDLLLRAFALLIRDEPAARLRLLTDSDFGPYRALARELGVLSQIEVRPVSYAELPQALRAASVLANPRLESSGVPQKLLNYMASATPVVSFAGSAKMLRHEESGLIVPDGDVAGFAQALLRLVRDGALAARLGERARELVTRHHSWEATAAGIEEVYGRVLAPGALQELPG